jgi:hypothetical protein
LTDDAFILIIDELQFSYYDLRWTRWGTAEVDDGGYSDKDGMDYISGRGVKKV